ncbi:hypothetical protein [Actinophytocola sp.]|uniref:hypothetical protein n=1 Tax=Actinophytocola sp. TaxID=1872138 RepID=UPI003D6C5ED1
MRTNLAPTSLQAIEQSFAKLTSPPAPLSLDGCCIGFGMPERAIPLDELRVMLLKRRTSWHAVDAVWTELVRRAQDEGEPWVTAAIGMMMPALKKVAGDVARDFRGDIADFDSNIVEGFLYALKTVDPRTPRVYSRLRSMAQRYGMDARLDADRDRAQSTEYDDSLSTRYRPSVEGHPDLVLARAVRDHGLTDDEAGLIVRACLEGEGTSSLAEERGVSPYQFRRQLARAEARLKVFLSGSVPLPVA